MSELLAGVGRANITPPVGIPMAGFAGRGPAQGIHDDLFATTLALEAAGTRALIVTADVIGFTDDMVPEFRAEIAQATGIPETNILLCASHTHYNAALGEGSPIAKAYRQSLKYHVAGSAIAAISDMAPAHVGFGKGKSSININRRERVASGDIILGNNPEGPCDKDVLVIRVDLADGTPLAALVNYACHP